MLSLLDRLANTPRVDGGILDAPIEKYLRDDLDEDLAQLLYTFGRGSGDATLRNLVANPMFRRWVESSPDTPLRSRVVKEIGNIIDIVSAELGRAGARGGASTPTTGERLESTALPDHPVVAETLRLPAAAIERRLSNDGRLRMMVRSLGRLTIGDLLDEREFDSRSFRARPSERSELAATARKFILERLERARLDETRAERIAALNYMPKGDGARAFLAALDQTLQSSTADGSGIRFGEWTFRDDPARIRARAILPPLKASDRPSIVGMSLSLQDWRNAALPSLVKAESGRARTGAATRAFLAGVRVLAIDPEDPLHDAFVAFLNEPAWKRVLAGLNKTLARPAGAAKEASRVPGVLEWWISNRRPMTLGPRLGWGVDPTRHPIPPDAILRGEAREASALDERVAQALVGEVETRPYGFDSYRFGGPGVSDAEARDRAFRALVLLASASGADRNRVRGPNGQALRVVCGDVQTRIEGDDEGGFRFVFSIDGFEIAPGVLRDDLDSRGVFVRLDLERNLVFGAHVGTEKARLLFALAREAATFPATARDALVEVVIAVSGVVAVVLPPALVAESSVADSRPLVRAVRVTADALELTWLVRPIAKGEAFPTGEGPTQLLQAVAGRTAVANRDLAEERRRREMLLAKLPFAGRDGSRAVGLKEMLAVIEVLTDAAAAGEVVVEWPKELPRVVSTIDWSKLKLVISRERDWFGVKGAVDVDGEPITLAELLAARRRGESFVVVGKDKLVKIAKDLEAKVAELDALGREGKGGITVTSAAVPLLGELVDDEKKIDGVPDFWALLDRIKTANKVAPKVPRGFTKVLRPYQVDGFRWMSRLAAWGGGACLADEMGLGKTVQTLALLTARSALGPALIVAPTSVGPNWLAEAKRFAPSLTVTHHRGAQRDVSLSKLGPGSVLVTSYDIMVRDEKALAKTTFATLILDEAQAIKNIGTARAQTARALQADFRLALTGTPVENRLLELHSLMDFLNPAFLGNEEWFHERWVVPIERDGNTTASAALARLIRPFILRRQKKDVLKELPPRTEVTRVVERSAAERRLYEAARQLALEALGGADEKARFRILAEIMRLRRLACHPRLDDETSKIESSKLATFLELVTELREGGHRALVFSQFTGHLALVEEALKKRSIGYQYLDGQTPLAERTKRVAAFQAGEGDLFLVSLKAGGTGLNLTAADTVIHLDPWWNPAVEDQASDRAHRIGQQKPVTVIRLIAQGTIEEAVMSLHAEKRQLAESILEGTAASGKLSIAELGALIREGASA